MIRNDHIRHLKRRGEIYWAILRLGILMRQVVVWGVGAIMSLGHLFDSLGGFTRLSTFVCKLVWIFMVIKKIKCSGIS